MTIQELLDRVLVSSPDYDEEFAEYFQSLVQQVNRYRSILEDTGPENIATAIDYRNSWSELLSLFADDPASLAAFTAPPFAISQSAQCAAEQVDVLDAVLTAGTPTTTKMYLYEAGVAGAQEELGLRARPRKPKKTARKKRVKAPTKKQTKVSAKKRKTSKVRTTKRKK